MLEQTVANNLDQAAVAADLGIEVEAELSDVPLSAVGWNNHDDNSLRGHSREYVTPPIKRGDVKSYTKSLLAAVTGHSQIVYSFRAGVHVHINCQSLTLEELVKFTMLYYMYEIPLTEYCGPDRVGNSFCLRAIDAEDGLTTFISAIRERNLHILDTDNIRYAALNFKSLPRYGTVEFRAMATNPNLDKLEPWVNILLQIKDKALGFANRWDMLGNLSKLGVEAFTKEVFGEYYDTIFPQGVKSEEIYVGLELAQDINFFAV